MKHIHTCNTLSSPVLETNSVIFAIINLFNGRSTIKHTLRLTGDFLRKMAEAIPLATLLCSTVNTAAGYYRKYEAANPQLTWVHGVHIVKRHTSQKRHNLVMAWLTVEVGII